jgi:redox-sensitive bicupin YhaK (pirin superfamily)
VGAIDYIAPMSGTLPANEPECTSADSSLIALAIHARPRDLGGFSVRRVLPAMARRMVGPFIFFDHMGPVRMEVGKGMDVRPHPHIELATVTYLFDGEIDHKDTLGSFQTIRPGDVNWMVAGRGIAHSERSGPDARKAGVHIHGIQSWVALPLEAERTEPRFEHHAAATIPRLSLEGAVVEVIAGSAYGARSPVGVLSPTLYVHAQIERGARLHVDDTHEERAVYVVEGAIECDGTTIEAGTMIVLRPGAGVTLTAKGATRAMLVGGAKLTGERHVYWNFVSSSKERIEQAKGDWQQGRFPKIPGDDVEFIPLPEQPTPSRTTA